MGAGQHQLFDTPQYSYRVFVTNLGFPIDVVVGFYRQRAGAENLIKEANNDAGLAAHPSGRWAMNRFFTRSSERVDGGSPKRTLTSP